MYSNWMLWVESSACLTSWESWTKFLDEILRLTNCTRIYSDYCTALYLNGRGDRNRAHTINKLTYLSRSFSAAWSALLSLFPLKKLLSLCWSNVLLMRSATFSSDLLHDLGWIISVTLVKTYLSNSVAASLTSAVDLVGISTKAVETDNATSVTLLTNLMRSSETSFEVYDVITSQWWGQAILCKLTLSICKTGSSDERRI